MANWLADISCPGSLPCRPARQPSWVICHGWWPQQLTAPRQGNVRLLILQLVLYGLQEPFFIAQWTHQLPSRRASGCRTGVIWSRLFSNWYQAGHWTFAAKGMARQLWRVSLSLLGGHVDRGLISPSDKLPWEPVCCPQRYQAILPALAGPPQCDCVLISMSSRNASKKISYFSNFAYIRIT